MRAAAAITMALVAFMTVFSGASAVAAGELGDWHYLQNVDDFTDEEVDEAVVLGPQMFSTGMVIFRYSYKTAVVDGQISLGGSVNDGQHKLIYRINKLPPVTIDCTTAGSLFFTFAILSKPAASTLARDLAKADADGEADLVVMIEGAPSTKKRFAADKFLVALAASDSLKYVLGN